MNISTGFGVFAVGIALFFYVFLAWCALKVTQSMMSIAKSLEAFQDIYRARTVAIIGSSARPPAA